MARRVLISFLGKGRRPDPSEDAPQNASAARSGYQTARYRFPSADRDIETTYFGWALNTHLAQKGQPTDCMLILGTPTSSWSVLADVLLDELSEGAVEGVMAWQDRIHARESKGESTTDADLQELLEMAADSPTLKGVQLRLIPPGVELEEQHEIMRILLDTLEEQDRVILDITHGYRHLPVVVAFMLSTLQWRLNLVLEQVHYGALDMTPKGGSTPAASLDAIPEYSRIGSDLATYKNTGNYTHLAKALDMRNPVSELYFLENITREQEAQDQAKECLNSLKCKQGLNPLQESLRGLLEEELKRPWRRPADRFLSIAEASLDREDYLKALIYVFEAITRHPDLNANKLRSRYDSLYRDYDEIRKIAIELLSQEAQVTSDYDTLRRLRNAVVHADLPRGLSEDARDALRSKSAMAKQLRHGVSVARKILGQPMTEELWNELDAELHYERTEEPE